MMQTGNSTPPALPDWIAKTLDAASCGITVADANQPDTPLIYVNRAFEVMTGYPRDELLGRNCRFLQGGDRAQPELALLRRAFVERKEVTVVLRNYRKDGTLFWNELRLAPICDDQGRLTHYVGIQSDVTAQRERESRLLEEEARHRALLNSALDAIITIDGSGTIQSVNPATQRIFGYRPEELLGHNVSTLMPEPHRQQHDGYIEAYLKTGQVRMIGTVREMTARRKDGTLFPVDVAVSEVQLAHGSVFKGIVRDISKRKAAEELASRTLAELKKSQENLLALLNQFRVGTLILDAQQCVEFVSESCEQLDIDRSAALGQPWEQVMPFGMPSKLQLQQLLELPARLRRRITLHWLGADQTPRWVECDVRDAPQGHARHILLLYDVTEIHRLRQAIEESHYGRMLGNSPPMRELFRLIHDIARGEWTVLIEGETGVGKELVAHSIHTASARKDGPFVTVNAAGLSESLLASQLFGHRKGAFTGAIRDQEGFFEAAHGGTLFLDEIGDLPLGMQASLLRVLQEREITRLGETQARKVDVRILAATHKDLAQEVREGRFREDLLYRLRVARLRVPPLRERSSDIPLLAEAFLAQSYHLSSRAQPRFGSEAMQCLLNYPWPGNVRELKACVDYAVIHCKGERITPRELPPEIGQCVTATTTAAPQPSSDERSRILTALESSGGNRQQAARLLGISRATLYRRLSELNIAPPR